MHISKLSLLNYRNFANASVLFNKGINTVIGENGSGKTNLFRAIRLLLDDYLIRSAYRLDEVDFHRGLKDWRGHWIIISIEFDEISADEVFQALFRHGTDTLEDKGVSKATFNLIFRPKKEVRVNFASLTDGDVSGLEEIRRSITVEDYETIFTGRSTANFNDPAFYKEVVGDFENVKFSKEIEFASIGARIPKILSVAEEVSFTFVQALRDVLAQFHNNKTNPLLKLLKSKSGDIDQETFANLTEEAQKLNKKIEHMDDVQRVQADVIETMKQAAGEAYSPSSLSIKSDLPDEAEKLFQSLKLFVGEFGAGHEGPISDLSLGGANLIFLTLKLLEFKYRKSKDKYPIANFLLIEEPEAHLHTHIQKTLFDRLNYEDTQVIYSTHSTHISEVSNVQNMNILVRDGERCESYQPSTGLKPMQIHRTQRYLDAVRSNLLFAKSVILVEGDAEEILIPILVKKVLGITLDELGISLVNIRSTGFKNVAILFNDKRIRRNCSIVTDLDKSIIDTTLSENDPPATQKIKKRFESSEKKGIERKNDLERFALGNQWIKLFFAEHTFEVDFISAGNAYHIIELLPSVYKNEATKIKARAELNSKDVSQYGMRTLTMAENLGKGWFAILLGEKVNFFSRIPMYILNAIFFAQNPIARQVWDNILHYRLDKLKCYDCDVSDDDVDDFMPRLEAFSDGSIELEQIKKEMRERFSHDPVNNVLDAYFNAMKGGKCA